MEGTNSPVGFMTVAPVVVCCSRQCGVIDPDRLHGSASDVLVQNYMVFVLRLSVKPRKMKHKHRAVARVTGLRIEQMNDGRYGGVRRSERKKERGGEKERDGEKEVWERE